MYCIDLNITIPFLKPNVDITAFKNQRHFKFDTNLISDGIKQWLADKGMSIGCVECFYNPPYGSTPLHLDNKGEDFTRLNWIYGGKGSNMIWFVPKPGIKPVAKSNKVGTGYLGFNPDDVNEVYRQEVIGTPTMVRVSVPHQLINGPEDRWAISVTPLYKGRTIIWEDAVQLLAKHNTELH
jgi:hypothetical protein